MSEGELKKRIEDFICHGRLDGKNVPYPKYEQISIMEVINRFLDEAAKEFPMTELQIRLLLDEPCTDIDLKNPPNAPDPVEVAKWFKKYFLGDVGTTISIVVGGCAGHIDLGKLKDIEKE